MDKLKPCPYCGGEATINQTTSGYGGGEYTATFECGCNACKIFFYGETRMRLVDGVPVIDDDGYAEASTRWNRRCDDGK